MAITPIIAATKNATSGAGTEFTSAGRGFWLHGSGFQNSGFPSFEFATVQRVGPSGDFEDATNKEGKIQVSANPNSIFVDLPAGTYRINKSATVSNASVGWEEEA